MLEFRRKPGIAPPPIPVYSCCMDATACNALATARRLREAGFDREQAEATADRDTLAIRADIEAAVAGLEARLYRALWVQGGGIVAIVAAFNLFA